VKNMSECGFIFNRHNWKLYGFGPDMDKYDICSKCGEVRRSYIDKYMHIRYENTTFYKAKIATRVAERHKQEDGESKKQALEWLNSSNNTKKEGEP
jgi:hypothetical protein